MTSGAANGFCGTCTHILDTISDLTVQSNLVHHRSIKALEESAEEACGICTVLLDHLQSSAFQQVPDLWDRLFPIICSYYMESASREGSFELHLSSQGVNKLRLEFVFDLIKASVGDHCRYIPSSSTDSAQSWELISQWLNRCAQNHGRCNAPIPKPWGPTRLLDIGTVDDGDVRLVTQAEGLSSKQPYATLSHCWGIALPIRTTVSNIDDHRKGIHYMELPNTFRDAVNIVRALNLRYMWIDALCIVQDSPEDWRRESCMMSNVYRYGFINIAATGAAQSSEGCFWKREPNAIKPTEVSIRWHGRGGRSESKRYLVLPEPRKWAGKLVNEPLNRRGWVLQERILARRVLHFGHEQLFWECRESVACETYPLTLPSRLQGNRLVDIKMLGLIEEPRDNQWPREYMERCGTFLGRTWSTITKPLRSSITLNATMLSASVYRDWNAIVELYSLGTLTFPKDKLVALSGVASAISASKRLASDDKYLAGLWQASLPSSLLWKTEKIDSAWGGRQEAIIPTRYDGYVAPSWSWACIRGKIWVAWCHTHHFKRYLAVLKSAEVELATEARFGQVRSATVTLSGPLACVKWQPVNICSNVDPVVASITNIFPPSLGQDKAARVPPGIFTGAEIHFDTADEELPRVLILLSVYTQTEIVTETFSEIECVCGLVLRPQFTESGPLQRKPQYSRLGVFHTTRPGVCRTLATMPRQSVVIV
ncbi:HET-domain-containing protein [Lentithecium fluviatile CBS 122367]|uniref:HET-domain-containing protein n=1 Tax=Lentithecium fluviatile CBS 122367 TaxID=1168545 RepID=A0A6G1JBI9_9PLEO|nr:HET-domain-containing protein [Lentithecium fluviatile CBS 122367]